ncbi:MAG: hypothetical protein H0U76_08400 [Ktedonobacteraceae bacterium]|nr:hypothetical protein [Ktedonobacteraceae bacterium]
MKNIYPVLRMFSVTLVLFVMAGIASLGFSAHIAHAGGTGWSVVPSANVSPVENSLQSVAALSTNKVWAVGYSVQGATKSTLVKRTLVEHYNGTIWQVVTSPDVGTGDNVLTGVSALSANNVWAVGYTPLGALTLHYNGAGWHLVPAPAACQFNAVTAITSNDVWAVGTMSYRGCAEHYNGTSWNLVTTPVMGKSDNTLLSVAASSSHDVWAVGNYCIGDGCDRGGGSFQTMILHYIGGRWSVVPSPNPSPYANQLNAVTVISATDAWAVGASQTNPMTGSTLIVHYDGISWTQVVSPGVNSRSVLTGIASVSATDMFAVGSSTSPTHEMVTLIEHFDGTTWSIVASPSPGNGAVLNGLTHVADAPLGTAQFWAVGSYSTNTSGSTLTERDI